MKNITGMEAAVYALQDCDVKIMTGVPGFPVTDLMENITGKIKNEWSVNEKVALEIALGSSISGQRSAVITKHVGMNILADPLVSSTTHTIGAGVVIFAGDDPGIQKSQNEQDSRFYGLVAEVPVFDPSTPQGLYQSVLDGYELSEEIRAPVIIRLTDRLLKSRSGIKKKGKTSYSASFDKKIWDLTMLGKHQRFHRDSYPMMYEYAERSELNDNKKRGKNGIISSGYPGELVESIITDIVSHLSLGVVNPLPFELVDRFIKEHERVLVVEETEPVIESQLHDRVLGKLTGHMPYGIIESKDIREAIENFNLDEVERVVTVQTIAERGVHPVCEDCPYLPLYNAVKEQHVQVAGDLGCSILTSAPPLSLLDAAFSLGSSIGIACGFNRKGIAIVGDYGLMHSGLAGLIDAVHNKHAVVVIVLQNEVAAMTGGQRVPDLTGLVRSLIRDTEVIDMHDDIDLKKILQEKLAKTGISVILARARCPKYDMK
ncbi:MAG: thiamine pyrophosphate-dependent enzyme [Candidatus Methanoperedens sp.]|nr:thiamine pyrophosphate-dependent enzyme [Candidatus Methanoperedens sp.]